MTAVSVIFPSRGRQSVLRDCIDSLRDTAAGQVEILVAIDPDEAGEYCMALPDGLSLCVTPQRWGYAALHEYYGYLAARARGEWLLIFNDDATMETPGWDQIIAGQDAPAVLWPYCPQATGMNVFPAFPAAWARHLGHVARHHSVDRWVQETGERLGRVRHIPVTVRHLCVLDQTAGERGFDGGYYSPGMVAARERDAASLREFLASAPPANTRLVSVLAADPGRNLAGDLARLLAMAAGPQNVEFLVTGEGFRGGLEHAGIMGYGEVHSDGDDLARWAHGRWQVRLEDIQAVTGWDELVRR
jgi:hypothetical protein